MGRKPRLASVPAVLLAADSLAQSASGIARVARLMARVLATEVRAGRLTAEAWVLRDEPSDSALGLRVRSARGSQARFALEVHRAALSCSHFLYDVSGIARAHPRVVGLRRPYLTWIHGIEAWEQAEEKRLRKARGADVLLANSEYTRNRALGLHAGLEHSRVCWLATESDASPEPKPRMESSEPIATILGRLDDGGGYKGHRELIACWPDVVAKLPSARLRIAGDGPGRDVLSAWVERSPVRNRIELLGFVPQERVEAMLRESTVLAMPSRGEGFGLVYVEAMRVGLPVIASIHDAAPEINLEGQTGYDVDLDRAGELSERLCAVLGDPALAAELGARAQQRWSEHFCFNRFAARFKPHLEELLAKPHAGQ